MAIEAQLNYITGNSNIGLSLIGGGSEFSVMNNGYNDGCDQFYLNLQQKLLQRIQNQQILSHENYPYQNFNDYVEKQKQEIDRFIRSQNERLKFSLQEQKIQQIQMILKRMEAKALFLLRQKDQEIAKASNKSLELKALLQKIEIDNQTWQRLAKENEAMVVSLNTALEKMREKACHAAAAEDEGSCCGDGGREVEGCLDAEKMVCRSCGSRESCVLFLPCRHLCSCRDCEVFLDSCPVCSSAKKASIEALIF